MSRQTAIVVTIILVALGLALLLIGAGMYQARKALLDPEQPGATVNTPSLSPQAPASWPPPAASTTHRMPKPESGRHHEGAVDAVPPDWMLPTGYARQRAMDETRQLKPIREDGAR